MTADERKERFRELQDSARPHELAMIEINAERVKLATEIATDELRATFPQIEVRESIFNRIESRTPETSAPAIIAALKLQDITPTLAIVDTARMQVILVP